MSSGVDFLVKRDDFSQWRFDEASSLDPADLAPGEVLFEVEKFALTANNVTYAVVGETMSYWDFFPAPEGWGRIPVWGFGRVVASECPEVVIGERVFGYFPPSTHLTIGPVSVDPAMIFDGAAHRHGLPPFYNQYPRVAADPFAAPGSEAAQMLLRPLFLTAFLLDDFLGRADLFGAQSILLTSASSKTAFSLAALLRAKGRAPGKVVGLTSTRNLAFVEGLGCYDRVVSYDDLASLPAGEGVAIVDMAGNGSVLAGLHRHFGAGVKQSTLVGFTHYDRMQRDEDLPGATPTFFFAPDQARDLAKEIGPEAMAKAMLAAWAAFLRTSAGWIEIREEHGPEALTRVYEATLRGEADPAVGHILSLV